MLAVDEDSPALFRFGFRGAERGLPILEKMARMQQERERLEEEQRQRRHLSRLAHECLLVGCAFLGQLLPLRAAGWCDQKKRPKTRIEDP